MSGGIRVEARGTSRRDRLGVWLAILVAVVALVGTFVGLRIDAAGSAAAEAGIAAVEAARNRASTLVTSDGLIARALEAWVDYRRARTLADELGRAGQLDESVSYGQQAVSHWFFVPPAYLVPGDAGVAAGGSPPAPSSTSGPAAGSQAQSEGSYDRDLHRRALLSSAAARADLEPESHLARMDAESSRLGAFLLGRLILLGGLPILIAAQLSRDRPRRFLAIIGGGVVAAGGLIVGLAWL